MHMWPTKRATEEIKSWELKCMTTHSTLIRIPCTATVKSRQMDSKVWVAQKEEETETQTQTSGENKPAEARGRVIWRAGMKSRHAHAFDASLLEKMVLLRTKVCMHTQRTARVIVYVCSCLCASTSNQPPLVRCSAGESVLSESDIFLIISTCFHIREII